MKLPNAEHAVIDLAKLRDYCLNPNHPTGKHKARIFREKLEFTRDHAEQLRKLISDAILTAEAIEQEPSVYGRRFVVDFGVVRSQGFVVLRSTVRATWMMRTDEDFPRLTSCYIPKRGS